MVQIARDHQVPVLERPSLAWALYRTVRIGQEVPVSLYFAVAEVLAFVYRMRGRFRKAG
jgi:flagellar biosynthetic protein FlhB